MNAARRKIAFLVGKFPAISETFILNQITGLIDAGHQVDIFAKERPADLKVQPEVHTYRLLERTRYFRGSASKAERLLSTLRVMAKLVRHHKPQMIRALDAQADRQTTFPFLQLSMLYPLLDGGPYDILHCHFGSEGLTGARLKAMGVPGKLIVAFHGYDISQFLHARGDNIYRSLFETADLLMPISQYWKQRLVQLGADPTRIRVHRMGIDLNNFSYHPRRPLEKGEVRLVTVGRLVEKKGIPFALQAVAKLLQRHPQWKIHYTIIGEGEQESELRGLVSQLGLHACVRLMGARTREEVRQWMLESDIFLLPSVTDSDGDQEGIPVSLMEAMATGMPILSTLHTGIPELVEDGISGYLVPERDVDGLADRLEHLIRHPEDWPIMGLNGRRFVEAHHDIHVLNRHLIDTYNELLYGIPNRVVEEPTPAG